MEKKMWARFLYFNALFLTERISTLAEMCFFNIVIYPSFEQTESRSGSQGRWSLSRLLLGKGGGYTLNRSQSVAGPHTHVHTYGQFRVSNRHVKHVF